MRTLQRKSPVTYLALVCIGLLGCEKRTPAPESPPVEKTQLGWLKIDGEVDDWPEDTLVLSEVAWPVEPGEGMEVSGLHLLASDRALGLFLMCNPSPGKWYQRRPSLATPIAKMLLDVDDDPSTGSEPGGFEAKMEFLLVVGAQWTPQRGSEGFYETSVNVSRWDETRGEFRGGVLFGEWNSHDTPDLIADGPDGLELVLKPEALGIAPGAKVRIVLQPWASLDSHRSEHQWTLRFQGASDAASGP
jgi:hypothetical protein